MDDAMARLAAAVADGGPGAALHALRWASAWSVPSVAAATGDGDGGELPAIEAVILLDDALTQLTALLGAAPALLAAARPGGAVETYLADRSAELDTVTEQVRTTRVTLARLEQREEVLRERLDELAGLRERVGELRRLERLVSALDELDEQSRLISGRLAALRAMAGDTERRLADGGAELVRLTEERRRLLAPETRRVLDELARADAELAAEERRAAQDRAALAEATRRHAELLAERDERLAGLAAHAEADRVIADGLAAVPGLDDDRPALERVRSVADEVDQRLQELDGVLRRVLDERDDRHRQEHTVLPWSG